VEARKLIFRAHAIQRMFERQIGIDAVRIVVRAGEVIEEYPDDYPFASRLILGWEGRRPLHVVAAENTETGETIVITVYEPDSTLWDTDFRNRTNQ
jgi:hypothetical protein